MNDSISTSTDPSAVPKNSAMAAAAGSDDDPYTLSEQDRMLIDGMVPLFIFYKMPSHVNDRQLVIDSMQRGLDTAAEQLPPLAAKMHLDDMGRPLRHTSPAGPLKLHVRVFDPGEFPSYDELAQRSFSPGDVRSPSLIPDEMAANPSPSPRERRICFVQLNFVPGDGVILMIAFSHMAADVTSMSLATSLICKCTKAYMEGTLVPQHTYSYDRRPFLPKTEVVAAHTKEQLIAANDKHQTLKIIDSATAAPNKKKKQDTNCRRLVYRMTASDAKALKDLCKPIGDVEYVSTYDCIFGLLLRVLMRIRSSTSANTSASEFMQIKECKLVQALNLRARKIIPTNYFGCGLVCGATKPLSVDHLLGPDGLSLAASSIRSSVMHDDHLSDLQMLMAVPAKLDPDRDERALVVPVGLPKDCLVATGWHGVDVANWDFGIGPPAMLRRREGPLSNVAYLYPDCQRAGVYDLDVYVYEEEQALLRKDAEFRRWFQVFDGARY